MQLHPVKQETFDVARKVNVDPKGFDRVVDVFTVTDHGLYMARGADHPRFGYLESWLLPEHCLRVNTFHFRPGHGHGQRLYIDVADIDHTGNVWTTRDLYVDIVTYEDRPSELLDLDELAAAAAASYIDSATAHHALDITIAAWSGITHHAGDVAAWLDSLGVAISWAPRVTLMPAGD